MTLHFAPNPARPLIIDSFAGGGGASTGQPVSPPVARALVAANCGYLTAANDNVTAQSLCAA